MYYRKIGLWIIQKVKNHSHAHPQPFVLPCLMKNDKTK